VIDLSGGIAGPVATMLLADHGAEVTKIEPPEGDPFRSLSGYRVWGRGKRSAVLDLKNAEDAKAFRALVCTADVLVESFSPGTMRRLGVSYDDLRTANPRLVYCSSPGTAPRASTRPGPPTTHSSRPGPGNCGAPRRRRWHHLVDLRR